MKEKKQKSAQKRKYDKPRIRAIRLSADEVLATGCKTSPVSVGFGDQLCTSGFCSSTTGS